MLKVLYVWKEEEIKKGFKKRFAEGFRLYEII